MTNQINKFYLEFYNYVDFYQKEKIKEKYYSTFLMAKRKIFRSKLERKFIKDFKHLDKYVNIYNDKYINSHLNDDLFNNINGYRLDINQKKAVITDEINNLIIAGAGCGKTLTIVAKVKYLIYKYKVNPQDIVCISFTNDSCNSLRRKTNNIVEVLTFHKLALKILKGHDFHITNTSINYVIDEYFNSIIFNNVDMIKKVLQIFKDNTNNIDAYDTYLKSRNMDLLKQLIVSFINQFKANNYSLSKFVKMKLKYKEDKNILSIIIDIYLLYEMELKSQNEIDFNDMINMATKYVIDNKFNLGYKYIIVDEYQDTSWTRYKLLKALIDNTGAKLIAVGDDWQSIYKFTGCNLDIFLKFESYFGYTKKMYITNTYRNCQELINVAGKFILKNQKQIKKSLKSFKKISKPIKIIYESYGIMERLIEHISKLGINNIMILGRNNIDIYKFLSQKLTINRDIINYECNKRLNIRYLTVHKSKGLEADSVIIINLVDDILGFPNKICSHHIIELISNRDSYLFEEERRLFYVALTRTMSDVYLIIPKDKCSIFVKEVIKDSKQYIDYINL